jgi:hypothetical protein
MENVPQAKKSGLAQVVWASPLQLLLGENCVVRLMPQLQDRP